MIEYRKNIAMVVIGVTVTDKEDNVNIANVNEHASDDYHEEDIVVVVDQFPVVEAEEEATLDDEVQKMIELEHELESNGPVQYSAYQNDQDVADPESFAPKDSPDVKDKHLTLSELIAKLAQKTERVIEQNGGHGPFRGDGQAIIHDINREFPTAVPVTAAAKPQKRRSSFL
ncbi:MAG: hypothetical protein AAF483_16570, partial [Planctomycetota bacterium]